MRAAPPSRPRLLSRQRTPDARNPWVTSSLGTCFGKDHQRSGILLQAGNLVASRLWEQRRAPPRALAAVRRRPSFDGPDLSLPVPLHEEGRLAAATGDRAGALIRWAVVRDRINCSNLLRSPRRNAISPDRQWPGPLDTTRHHSMHAIFATLH